MVAYDPSVPGHPNPYGELLRLVPTFTGLMAEEITRVNPELGPKFVIDGLALESSVQFEFERLRLELVQNLRNFRSDQTYVSAAVNQLGDRFLTMVDYLDSLGLYFSTKPDKVERLKIDLIKTLIEIVPRYAGFFIPEEGALAHAYDLAEQELANQQIVH